MDSDRPAKRVYKLVLTGGKTYPIVFQFIQCQRYRCVCRDSYRSDTIRFRVFKNDHM